TTVTRFQETLRRCWFLLASTKTSYACSHSTHPLSANAAVTWGAVSETIPANATSKGRILRGRIRIYCRDVELPPPPGEPPITTTSLPPTVRLSSTCQPAETVWACACAHRFRVRITTSRAGSARRRRSSLELISTTRRRT